MEAPPHLLQFFEFDHLPADLREVSRPFHTLAHAIVDSIKSNPERTVALRKLLEAKDAAVRAVVCERPPAPTQEIPRSPPPPPVDRSAVTTTDGRSVDEVRAEQASDPSGGQHASYIVLAPGERAKGFVRPVRKTYKHEKCGATTSMGVSLAETYARDPGFYGSTFCSRCNGHFPVGAGGQFVWEGTDEKVGT